MLINVLRDFPKQFSWEPKIENEKNLRGKDNFVVAGMGGSHLAADIVRAILPSRNIKIHSDYNLPHIADSENTLAIASSYSGNTEETLDALNTALDKKLAAAAITTGGKLLELAQKNNIPYVQMPAAGIQPRFALGYSFVSLLKLMGENSLLNQAAMLAEVLNPKTAEEKGMELAQKLENKIPVIYSSAKNFAAARNWKIKFNETGKIPAFCNVFPELNHNEMNGFDTKGQTMPLMENFQFIFLKNYGDEERIIKRMEATKNILERQELKVDIVEMPGESPMHKIFQSLMTADFASYYLAQFYGNDPEQTPMIEDFKGFVQERSDW